MEHIKTTNEILLEIKKRIKMCEDAPLHSIIDCKSFGVMEGTLKSLLDWIEGKQ